MTSVAVILSRVARAVSRQHLFIPGDTLIVAISGGADSTALLDLLSRIPDYNLKLIAVHLNHCLRSDESDADEEFCRGLASRYAITFEVRRIDVAKMADAGRLNLEDAGRHARITFFDEIREKYAASAVVLAHHADDQAETVLMRLLRGSGMTGLSGMAYRNTRGYVRPLLDISRTEIEQYLLNLGLEWREDSSNSDTVYLRNRIRHELLPVLETYNPAIRSTLAATAFIIGEDNLLLEELTERVSDESCRLIEGRVVCAIGQLRALSPGMQRRVLRYAFRQLVGNLMGMSLCHADALCSLIASDRPNSRLALPQGITAVREYDRLLMMQADDAALKTGFELLITEPGCYHLPHGGKLTIEPATKASFSKDPGIASFDLNKTPFPWRVRSFQAGDRITPFGMSGRKKVKDVFIDRKIPLSKRNTLPLLFCGADLIWVAGVCASELSRMDNATANPILITWCE